MATMSVTSGGLPKSNLTAVATPQFVSSLKQNTGFNGLLALNQAEEVQTPEQLQAEQLQAMRVARAEAIDAFFAKRKAPLAGYGMKMVLEAEKNGLPWQSLAAIATIESSGAIEACKKVAFSALGWGSCKIGFKSHEHGIEVVAWNLGGYNERTARYYKDKTFEQKLKRYNSVIPTYNQKIFKVMKMIGPDNLGEEIIVVKA